MGVSPRPSSAVVAPAGPSDSVGDRPYYIYASSSGKHPDENVEVLSPGSTTDTFVASLNKDKVITLSAPPDTGVTGFDTTDETQKWFQQLDSGATVSLAVEADKSIKSIESFKITLSEPWPLTFNSAADVLLFTFGAPPQLSVGGDTGGRIQPPGINADGDTLTCGLDFVNTKQVKAQLSDLFKYAQISSMVDQLPKALPVLQVTLDKPTESGKRNALWFCPGSDRRVEIRLQFQLPAFEALQEVLAQSLRGLQVKSTDVVCKKKVVLGETEKGEKPIASGSVTFSVQCSVKGPAPDDPEVPMAAGVEFSPSFISLTFIFLSENPLTGILKWLAGLVGDNSLEAFVEGALNKTENGSKVFADFTLRRLNVGLSTAKDQTKLSSFSFDVEVSANFGQGSGSGPPVFLISYEWDRFSGGFGTLGGQLWNDYESSSEADLLLLPYEELWTILQPITQSPADSIAIAALIPTRNVVNIPDTLPSKITRAYVELTKDSFIIGGTVTAVKPSPSSVPQPYLGEVTVDASFDWGESKSFALEVGIAAGIQPAQGSDVDEPALLSGSIKYDSSKKTWDFSAMLSSLKASTLAEFFESDAKDHVYPLIDSIAVNEMEVKYTYEPVTEGPDKGKSVSSKFSITGDLVIAQLRLGLVFKHDKDGFEFTATLDPTSQDATIGDALSAILGPDGIELPPFVANMKIVGSDENAFKLDIKKKITKVKEIDVTSFQFLAKVNVGNLHIDFAQLHSTAWGEDSPSKRLIRATVDGFPHAEVDVPLIGKLEQPIDELCFLWVQDPPQKSEKPSVGRQGGLTRMDVALLDDGLPAKLLVKDKVKVAEQKDTDLLVAAGCHFAVIVHSPTGEKSCLLDYVFLKPKEAGTVTTTPRDQALAMSPATSVSTRADASDADEGGPSAQAPFKKKTGPLSISNVGIKYKNKRLVIMFDATFAMGPVGFSLLGFSLEAEFETLDKVPNIHASIEGMAAAFDKPPLTIAGVIRHGNDSGMDYYAGGLIVGWVPYQFQAAGFFGTVTPNATPNKPFKSIFIFAKLDGPLITLEFAEITGVCGGFGYNSNVRLPAADEIYKFPFVSSNDIGGADNALEVLQKIIDPSPAGWFQPMDDMYWLALGMKVDAFQMLSIDAVVVAQFGASVKLGIFAVALADIPTAASPIKFAHVELGISAVADFDYGVLKVESQLSPRSYIFSEQCHLTGGSALYYWFDAPHADRSSIGNFVFTLGGYHQAFDVPAGYPNPPRLGISWSLGSNLSISGEAYFAITPKVCMGGGRLHAAFSAGPIEAWFDAFADFLINYKPFYFNAAAGIAVGVRFNIDILFIHTHISVEIGAQLYLWGPPLAGRVHVDLWIAAFDINFGRDKSDDQIVHLYAFYQLVLQSSSSSSSMASAARRVGGSATASMITAAGEGDASSAALAESDPVVPKNEGHNFLAQSGLLNPNEKAERPQNDDWIVRAGTFSFVVGCKMAINAVKTDPNGTPILTNGDQASGIDVFSKPMKLRSPMTSTVVVDICQDGVSQADQGWQYDKYIKNVPTGLWAKYDPNKDPRGGNNNVGELLKGDDSALPLMMGVSITAPKAHMAPDPFPAFKVDDADLERLSAGPFPAIGPADDSWAPAEPFGGSEVKKQFDAVYDAWVNPALGGGDGGQKGFVGILAEKMGWDDVAGLKSIAGIPDRLKKTFMNSYVAAPLLTK